MLDLMLRNCVLPVPAGTSTQRYFISGSATKCHKCSCTSGTRWLKTTASHRAGVLRSVAASHLISGLDTARDIFIRRIVNIYHLSCKNLYPCLAVVVRRTMTGDTKRD